MKYLITLLILICASHLFAQQSAQTNNAAVIEQLQERIASIEKQNEALKSEIDSLRQANDTLYSVFKSDIKKAEEYKEEIGFTHWSRYANVISSIASWIAIVIALFVGFQVYNVIDVNRRIKELSEKQKKQEEQNKEFEKVKESIEKMRNEQEKLNDRFLSSCAMSYFNQVEQLEKNKQYYSALVFCLFSLQCQVQRSTPKNVQTILNKAKSVLDYKGPSIEFITPENIKVLKIIFEQVNDDCSRIENKEDKQYVLTELFQLKEKTFEKFKSE